MGRMAPADVLASADRNFWQLFEGMAAAVPSGSRRQDGPLLLLATGFPAGFFNPTYVTGPVDDPEAAVRTVEAHYRDLGLPYVLVFRDGEAPGLAEACASAGLVEHWRLPLMVLESVPVTAPAVDGLEVEVVDDGNVREYAAVLAEAFGMPVEIAEGLSAAMSGIEGLVGLLGRIDGQPVATSAVYVTGTGAGVYNVAVPPALRRRGLGEALTGAAAAHGIDRGATWASLQASEAGEPVYRRMGYVTVDHYRQFEPPPN